MRCRCCSTPTRSGTWKRSGSRRDGRCGRSAREARVCRPTSRRRSARRDTFWRLTSTLPGLAAGISVPRFSVTVWEVGAGSPSVPAYLAAQVGPKGHVLATDIDTSWLGGRDIGYEVQRHDVGSDPPPAGLFDLGHARLLLVHLTQRERALTAMVAALSPGGWLLLEAPDPAPQPMVCPDEYGAEQKLANNVKHGFRRLLAERGVDLAYGRTLPRLLRFAGLKDVQSDAYFPMGGPACAELERATVEQVRDALIATGMVTRTELEQHLLNVRTGPLDLATSPMVSAWGRKPITS